MRMILLGPQGSGKGTQAQRLSPITGACHISTGDLVRAEIQAHTELGRRIKNYHDRGQVVPDEIMVALVEPHIRAAQSWILGGLIVTKADRRRFARQVRQAQIIEMEANHYGVMMHPDTVAVIGAFVPSGSGQRWRQHHAG